MYKNGKIYLIRNNINNKLYVGSTCQPLSKRFYKHVWDIKKRDNLIHQAIKEYGSEEFYIELLESFPCNTKEELTAREGFHIRDLKTHVDGYNKKIEGRDKKQYYIDNKEKLLSYHSEYRQKNQESLRIKKKQWFINNKDTVVKAWKEANKDIISEKNRLAKKQFYEKNKEHVLKQQKVYIEKNRERISAKFKVTFICECGSEVTLCNKKRHLTSKKHKSLMESKDDYSQKHPGLNQQD